MFVDGFWLRTIRNYGLWFRDLCLAVLSVSRTIKRVCRILSAMSWKLGQSIFVLKFERTMHMGATYIYIYVCTIAQQFKLE